MDPDPRELSKRFYKAQLEAKKGDFLVLDTSDDENDRLLFEDGTSDPIAVLASHGITLSGQGWNAFQFENP